MENQNNIPYVEFTNGYKIYHSDKHDDKEMLVTLLIHRYKDRFQNNQSKTLSQISQGLDDIYALADFMLSEQNHLFFIVKNNNVIGYIFRDIDKTTSMLMPSVLVIKDIYIHDKTKQFAFVMLVGFFINNIFKTNVIWSKHILVPGLEKLITYRNYEHKVSIFSEESYVRLQKAYNRFKIKAEE